MSTSGHWFDPESAEQYIATIASLQKRVATTYEIVVQKDLKQISDRLEGMSSSNTASSEETHRQIREVVDLVGRYKHNTAASLLEIEQEVKQIKTTLEKNTATDIDLQNLDIEKSKLQLERWKLILGIFAVFLTGLLFPVLLWWLGIVP